MKVATRPLVRIDAGWLFVIGGLAMLVAVVVLPGRRAVHDMREQLRMLKDQETFALARLNAYEEFLRALRQGDEQIIRRLAASHLNLVPEGETAVMLASSLDHTVPDWIDDTLEVTPSPETPYPDTLLIRLAEGRNRLWLLCGSVLVIFFGLIIGPEFETRPRRTKSAPPGLDWEPGDEHPSADGRLALAASSATATAVATGEELGDQSWAAPLEDDADIDIDLGVELDETETDLEDVADTEIGDETETEIGDETETEVDDQTETELEDEAETELEDETETEVDDETDTDLEDETESDPADDTLPAAPAAGGSSALNAALDAGFGLAQLPLAGAQHPVTPGMTAHPRLGIDTDLGLSEHIEIAQPVEPIASPPPSEPAELPSVTPFLSGADDCGTIPMADTPESADPIAQSAHILVPAPEPDDSLTLSDPPRSDAAFTPFELEEAADSQQPASAAGQGAERLAGTVELDTAEPECAAHEEPGSSPELVLDLDLDNADAELGSESPSQFVDDDGEPELGDPVDEAPEARFGDDLLAGEVTEDSDEDSDQDDDESATESDDDDDDDDGDSAGSDGGDIEADDDVISVLEAISEPMDLELVDDLDEEVDGEDELDEGEKDR